MKKDLFIFNKRYNTTRRYMLRVHININSKDALYNFIGKRRKNQENEKSENKGIIKDEIKK